MTRAVLQLCAPPWCSLEGCNTHAVVAAGVPVGSRRASRHRWCNMCRACADEYEKSCSLGGRYYVDEAKGSHVVVRC